MVRKKNYNDNSSICSLVSETTGYRFNGSLLLSLAFAFMFFSVDYQNLCIQSQLSLRHYPQLRFPNHLIPKKNQEKRNLYGKIPRRTSGFIGSTWRQVEGGVDDVTFSENNTLLKNKNFDIQHAHKKSIYFLKIEFLARRNEYGGRVWSQQSTT